MFIYLRSVTESLVIFPQILILTILDGDQKFQRSSLSQDIHQQEIVKGLSLKMYVFVLLSNPLYLVFRGRCLSKSGCPGGVFFRKIETTPLPPPICFWNINGPLIFSGNFRTPRKVEKYLIRIRENFRTPWIFADIFALLKVFDKNVIPLKTLKSGIRKISLLNQLKEKKAT